MQFSKFVAAMSVVITGADVAAYNWQLDFYPYANCVVPSGSNGGIMSYGTTQGTKCTTIQTPGTSPFVCVNESATVVTNTNNYTVQLFSDKKCATTPLATTKFPPPIWQLVNTNVGISSFSVAVTFGS